MTSFTVTTPTTDAQTLALGEIGFVSETGAILIAQVTMSGGTLLNHGVLFNYDSAVSISGGGCLIENSGTITGFYSSAVRTAFGHVTNQVHIVNRGSMTDGSAFGPGVISLVGRNQTIENFGSITATGSSAIWNSDSLGGNWGTNIINSGVISSSFYAAITLISVATDRLDNSGLVSGNVSFSGGGNDLVRNSGDILGNVIIGATGFTASLRNTGEIAGDIQNVYGHVDVRNAGHIAGDVTNQFGATLNLRNTGTIAGDITLQAGSNTIANSGTIQGLIFGGTGDDTYDMIGGTLTGNLVDNGGFDTYYVDDPNLLIEDQGDASGGQVFAWCDYVLGNGLTVLRLQGTAVTGIGNSTANNLTGNAVGNLMDGGTGTDVVDGRNGDDTLRGGDDADLVLGQHGNDVCHGDAGSDTIYGGAGDDSLSGGRDRDTINGDDGEDTLVGGDGRDVLTGGGDSDTFVYRRTSDSGTNNSARDTILSFNANLDVIDLSAIDASTAAAGNQAFTWLGAGAFTSVAGQLRFNVATNDLQADVTGDGIADFEVRLAGVTVLSGSDIVL